MVGPFERGGETLSASAALTEMANLYKERETETTAQERIQQALQESTEKFRNLFDHTSDAVFVIDPISNEILDANPSACNMLGYTREELLKLPISEVHPEEMDKLHTLATHVAAHGVGWTDELTCATKEGISLPAEISASAIGIAGKSCMVAVVRDIRDRIEADKELRQSEARYQDLYDKTPVMMHSIDVEGRLVSVNKQWLEVLGYGRNEVIGRRSSDFLTEDSRKFAVEEALPAFYISGIAKDVKLQMVKQNGDVINVLLSAFGQRDEKGTIIQSACFIIDVTDRERAEELLIEQMQGIAVVEERNRLAREIHDTLAQSLMGMVIHLELAENLLDWDSTGARTAIKSAHQLTRDSLEEVRRSVWDLHPVALEANGLLESVQQEVRKATDQGTESWIKVEGVQSQALESRCELAILRTVQEGLSNVGKHAQATRAMVRLIYESDGVRLVIEDDGIGFNPRSIEGVMSPTGGGFGLTSIKERARQVSGEIEIRSSHGVGTQLEMWVPYDPETAVASPALPTEQRERRELDGILGIFIVDDHQIVRQGIRTLVEQAADLVVLGEAGDGDSAIGRIKELAPDVVLLDIQMPVLDGVETLKRMRQQDIDTPVILLTTYAKDEYIFEGLRAGARGYLLKDVGQKDLVQAIRTVSAGGSLLQPPIANRLIQRLGDASADLTNRETEVLHLLASGARNKEIADQLMLSERTVRFHIANLYQKLEVQSRTQAVRVSRERGILR